MKASILVALAAMAFAPYACSGDPDDTPTPKVEVNGTEKVGSVSLDLLGTDTAGQAYRLRNAIFQLYPYYYPYPPDDGGFGNLTLSSETDPDATSIQSRLVPGEYQVYLQDGWYLEKLTPAGAEPVAQSVLLSPAFQYVYIYHQSTTYVNYAFGVDGKLIDFRHGDINISISIERPADGAGGSPGTVDAAAD